MTDTVGAHTDLHSERGAEQGEHPGRAQNPTIKVADIAWLEFEKPDLRRAEAFAQAFGFSTLLRTEHELQLRGTDSDAPCVMVRCGASGASEATGRGNGASEATGRGNGASEATGRGNGASEATGRVKSQFVGMAFTAQDEVDVLRLADAMSAPVRALPESIGGLAVDLVDPSGVPVRVVAGTHDLSPLPAQSPHTLNFGHEVLRANATQRPPRLPARVQRLGHVVLQSTKYVETLNWYLDNLGMIVSDFLYFPGQRDLGPTMSFIRCDRGGLLADHHTLALALGPRNRYVHSAYQVADLDALAAGGEYLRAHGYQRSWGIGRHIQGSQIFDYWRDPDGFMVEHFTDGDMFDDTLEPGWAAFTASGLAQWGPPVTKDFLGVAPSRESIDELRSMVSAVRDHDNEFTLTRLRGLLKVASS